MSEEKVQQPVRAPELFYDPFSSSGSSNITAFLTFFGILAGAIVFLLNAPLLWILVPVLFFALALGNMVHGSSQNTQQFKMFSVYLTEVKSYVSSVSSVTFTDNEYLHLAYGDVVTKSVENTKKDFFLDIDDNTHVSTFIEDDHNPNRED